MSGDTLPVERQKGGIIHSSTPYVSWASLLSVIGIVVAAWSGNLPRPDANAAGMISPPQIASIEAQLNDHAQKISDGRADTEGLKHDMVDVKQQLTEQNYKLDKLLELALEQKNGGAHR